MTAVYYLVAAALVVLDQITKLLTRMYLPGQGTITVIPGIVGLTYVENTGMAFSAFSGMTALLAVFSLAASVALAVAIHKRWLNHPFGQWMLTLLLAGAVGNFIDRAFMGFVTDMIQVLFTDFAVFNVADSCITVSAIGLAIFLVFWKDSPMSAGKERP